MTQTRKGRSPSWPEGAHFSLGAFPGALSPFFFGLLWAFATQVTRPHLHPQLGEAAAEEGVLDGTAEETVGK